MDKYTIALEKLNQYAESITPSEVKKYTNIPVDDLVKHGVLAPTNDYWKSERLYAVESWKIIDYNKKLPLSDPKWIGLNCSYTLPTRIEKIFWRWAKKNNLDINRLKNSWNKSTDFYIILQQFNGLPESEIIKGLNKLKPTIITKILKFSGAPDQSNKALYLALTIDSALSKKYILAEKKKISPAKKALVPQLFRFPQHVGQAIKIITSKR